MSKLILVIITVLMTGCVVQKTWESTGGSRSDGTVELSYEYSSFQSPELSEEQGKNTASQRCKRWGYLDAEEFTGEIRTCSMNDYSGGCSMYRVTKKYQCYGKSRVMIEDEQ